MIKKLYQWIRNKLSQETVGASTRNSCDDTLEVSASYEDKTPYNWALTQVGVHKCNELGVKLICEFEGFYPIPYLCPAGVPTIGYGTTIYPSGEGVQLSDSPISEKTAREYLAHDLRTEEDNLNKFMAKHNIELNSNQFSALISFAYNLGFGAISKRSSTVYKGLTQYNNEKVCYGMGLYVKAGGKTLKGLVRRRKAEVRLYKTLI